MNTEKAKTDLLKYFNDMVSNPHFDEVLKVGIKTRDEIRESLLTLLNENERVFFNFSYIGTNIAMRRIIDTQYLITFGHDAVWETDKYDALVILIELSKINHHIKTTQQNHEIK